MLEEILGSEDGDVDADCLNVAITACSQTADWPAVIYLFSELERAGIAPDAANYRAVIVALEREGDWRRALELYDEFLVGAGTAAAAAADESQGAGAGAEAEAETKRRAALPHELPHSNEGAVVAGRSDVDEAALVTSASASASASAAFDATSAASSSPSSDSSSTSTMHIQALRLELGPGLGCTLAALRACAKGGEWRRALALCRTLDVRQPSAARVERSMVIRGFVEALRACRAANEAGGVMDVLAVMKEYGLRPNLQCFTIAIATLEHDAANWQLVLDVVDMMREHGHDPSAIRRVRRSLLGGDDDPGTL